MNFQLLPEGGSIVTAGSLAAATPVLHLLWDFGIQVSLLSSISVLWPPLPPMSPFSPISFLPDALIWNMGPGRRGLTLASFNVL